MLHDTATVSYKELQGYSSEFFRLRDLPLPVPEHHQHYLDMWLRHDPTMSYHVKTFNEHLLWCEKRGCTPQQNRVDSKARFLEWAKEHGLINKLKWNFDGVTFQKLDRRKEFHGQMLLSIDMKKANFSILKVVALQRNGQIYESWERLCETLDIHPVLAGSKVFRQHCFGEYEPAKIADMQRFIIAHLIEKLELKDRLVYCSHDEVAIPLDEKLSKIKSRIISEFGIGGPIEFRLTPYRTSPVYDVVIESEHREIEKELRKIEEKKMAAVGAQDYEKASIWRNREKYLLSIMNTSYEHQIQEQSVPENTHPSYWLRTEYALEKGVYSEKKKSLFGVPTNRFYLYFRSALLKEPWQEKDFQFMQDGMMAAWCPKRKKQ